MTVISSLGFAGVSATVSVTVISQNPQLRLFRNIESGWIITKEDLESEDHAFSKVTLRGNIIEFSKNK